MPADSIKTEQNESSLIDPFVGKLEKLIGMQMRFELQTDDLFQKVLQRFDEIEIRLDMLNDAPDVSTEPNSSESAWDIQKRAIYDEYTGGSESNSPDIENSNDLGQQTILDSTPDATPENTPENVVDIGETEPDRQLPMTDDDRVEINRIKGELEEKLRQAEVELSISRAKISQERADLAEQVVEIERQNKKLKIDKQLLSQPRKKTQTSILDRFTRHMKSNKNQDDSED